MGNFLKKFKKGIIAGAIVLAQTVAMFTPMPVYAATGGFYVNGSKLYDANGNEFVMRGINHAHAWYKGNENVAIPAVARTGSNTVRVALSNGGQWGYDDVDTVKNIINIAKANNLVTVLEVHDATGMDSQYELDKIVNYWIGIKDALIGNEDTVIVNIANEWYGTWDSRGWADGYINAIPKLRAAGINNTLMVDCAGWGQYPKSVHDYGKEVFNADPNKNTMFSIHMYEYAGGNSSQVKSNIDGVINQGLALTIGEFGFKHTDGNVDEDTIMNYSQEKGVGYLGWSWYGNGDVWKYLDISYDWSGNNLTDWGKTLLYHQNGIKNTSKICSVFTGGGNTGGGDNNGGNTGGGSDSGNKITIEAENGYLNGIYTSTSRGGYSGNGYVTGFQNSSDSVEVTVNVDVAGEYDLNVQYASEYGDKYTTLYVNGNNYGEKQLKQSSSFTDSYLDKVYLNSGQNKITLVSNWGYYDIDKFTITGATGSDGDNNNGNNSDNNGGNDGDNNNGGSGNGDYLVAEAESGYLNGIYESSWRGGYSGNGYVTGFQNWDNSVEVTFNVPSSGMYHINVQYASEYGDKYTSLYVNGNNHGDKKLSQSSNFTDGYLDTVYLNAGNNTVKLQSNWGYYDIDMFSLTRE